MGSFFTGPALQRKNSGLLRYLFGIAPGGSRPPDNAYGSLTQGAVVIVDCLGGLTELDYDSDGQAFGESPGHAAVTGAGNFLGSNLTQQDATPITPKVQPNPDTGLPIGAAPTVYSGAGARIPAGTKVLAWFEMSKFTHGAYTIGVEAPIVTVQTEVLQNRTYRNGTEDTVGPQWLSSLRVAVLATSGAILEEDVSGVLWVKLQHSHLDIPGLPGQSVNLVASIPIP